MDSSTLTQTHSPWKLKLVSFCEKVIPAKLDPQVISPEEARELENWLFGEGRKREKR